MLRRHASFPLALSLPVEAMYAPVMVSPGLCVWAASAQAQGQRGYAFTKTPLDGIGTEWEIDVEFRIHGGGMTYYGDGFAMWYTPTKYEAGHCTSRSLCQHPATTCPHAHAT